MASPPRPLAAGWTSSWRRRRYGAEESAKRDDQANDEQMVTFARPFTLRGVDRLLPAGYYRVVTDEELIEAAQRLGRYPG
jgi:hypothetical protein